MNCKICNNPILKGQNISVFGGPIKATSNNGEYNILPDLINTEEIFHYKCLSIDKLINNIDSKDMGYEAKEILIGLGKKIKIQDINDIIGLYKPKDIPELVNLCLKFK